MKLPLKAHFIAKYKLTWSKNITSSTMKKRCKSFIKMLEWFIKATECTCSNIGLGQMKVTVPCLISEYDIKKDGNCLIFH